MAGFIDHKKAFISLFNQTARYHKRHRVFEDFVSCSVIALENYLSFNEARENKYLRIVSGYEKPDIIRMAQLLAHVVSGLQGCMVLTIAEALNRTGYPSHRYLWVSATDIDPLAAGMAYIQLSLCGVAGEVVIGNSLYDERRRVLLTPGHYLGGWPARLALHHHSVA